MSCCYPCYRVNSSGSRLLNEEKPMKYALVALLFLALAAQVQAKSPKAATTVGQAAAAESSGQFNADLDRATAGDARAMVTVGLSYLRGEFVVRDCFEAKQWLKQAADKGSVEALYTLGQIADNGECGLAEADTAFVYYKTAAEKGHGGAQYGLAQLYQTGRAGARDDRLAVKWYSAAAKQGYATAYCGMAQMYAKGFGVNKNKSAARKWAARGIKSGDLQASALCAEIWHEFALGD
jgi:uncharacterized protein